MKFRYLDNAEALHTSTLGLCRIAIGLVSERGLWGGKLIRQGFVT